MLTTGPLQLRCFDSEGMVKMKVKSFDAAALVKLLLLLNAATFSWLK